MKSILHNKKDRTCYLCMLLHGDDSRKEALHEHHVIYGWANRKLSEKYGLKVYLCLGHHEIGSEAVHINREIDLQIKEIAQRAFEIMWPEKSFREIFGKNYLMETEKNVEKSGSTGSGAVAGFMKITDGIEGMDW